MLTSVSISNVYVLDQDEALEFYVGKLGLEVREDQNFGPMRWLTVIVPGDPGHAVLLERPAPPSMDEASAETLRGLVTKGAAGWIGFYTDDAWKTFEDLKDKGVEIMQEPVEQGYGIDFAIRDPFGNQIRIVQPPS
jgi:catechol 2,3-dioxygenase-like lactoylglutathione lyase family enzyme